VLERAGLCGQLLLDGLWGAAQYPTQESHPDWAQCGNVFTQVCQLKLLLLWRQKAEHLEERLA
jgi:hypothetical protein